MANLDDLQSCRLFFEERIICSNEYWLDYIEQNKTNIHALDSETEQIIRTVSFGLDLEGAWLKVKLVIEKLAPYMEKRGHWDAWQNILNKAIQVVERMNDKPEKLNLLILLARLHQRREETQAVIHHYRQVISLAKWLQEKIAVGRACSNLGFLYARQDKWWRAEILCCYALEIFEENNYQHGLAHTHNHLGILYEFQRQWNKSKQHLTQACDLWQTMGDKHGLILGFMNLGSLYIKMENPEQALLHLKQAYKQAQMLGEESNLAKIYLNMGVAYRVFGKLDKAEEYAWQAEKVYRRFKNKFGLAQVRNNLATIYILQDRKTEAMQNLNIALSQWQTLGNKSREVETLFSMIECEQNRNNLIAAKKLLSDVENILLQYKCEKWAHHFQPQLEKYHRIFSLIGVTQLV